MIFNRTDARERKAIRRAFLRFLPFLVLLVLIASVLISFVNFTNTKHDIIDQQRSAIVAAMIDYRNNISDMTSIVHTIKLEYIELLGGDQSADAFEMLLVGTLQQYPMIEQLRVLDTDGMETLHAVRQNGEVYVVPPEKLLDKSDHDYFQETALLGTHQFLFSGLCLCMKDGQPAIDEITGLTKPVLRISSPLELGGQRVGYFSVSFLMREYLDAVRMSLDCSGCYVLMLDENGYLLNDADDTKNFGYCYADTDSGDDRTIRTLFPSIDLTAEDGSLIENDKICSFISFSNIYDRSKDYFLSETASKSLIFLVYYDDQSEYANDLHFSYFYQLISSWKMQLLFILGLLLLYELTIRFIFYYDRIRFTDLFSYNRYTKTMLRQAIKHHQFVNYYQPIINIQTGAVLGFEALCRWNTRGKSLAPAMFMDEILHYQLGQKLDENGFLLMRRDRERMLRYPEFADTFISINCCQQTFNSLIKDPPTTIIRLTEEEKEYVVLELVEDIIFNQATQNRISELYSHNILFAIDDFGTGNSNIAFIRHLENLKVKIDRTFVPVDPSDLKERIIIEAFVKMFIDQGMRLIVEGVETREQCEYMKSLGISGVQGFYFSKPMTIDQLIDFVRKKEYLDRL